jgi:hypothetical protein
MSQSLACTSRRARSFFALSLLAFAMTASSVASVVFAQPSASTIAGAQSLVGEGRKLRAAGDLQGARDRFQSAYLLVPTPIIGLDLGRAREALAELIEARAVLLECAALPPIPNESAESTNARAEALRIAKELDGRIPTITVTIAGADEGAKVVVAIDGVEIPETELTAPRAVDPGKHLVVARMGMRQTRTEIEVAEKDEKTAALVFPAIPPSPPPKVDAKRPTITDEEPRTRISKLTYVGFSVAGAGILVGSITGIISLKKAHDFAASCEGYNFQCPPSTRDEYDASRRYGNVSTVSFLVGGAGLALGIYGLFNREKVTSASSSSAPVALSLGVGSVAVGGAF